MRRVDLIDKNLKVDVKKFDKIIDELINKIPTTELDFDELFSCVNMMDFVEGFDGDPYWVICEVFTFGDGRVTLQFLTLTGFTYDSLELLFKIELDREAVNRANKEFEKKGGI